MIAIGESANTWNKSDMKLSFVEWQKNMPLSRSLKFSKYDIRIHLSSCRWQSETAKDSYSSMRMHRESGLRIQIDARTWHSDRVFPGNRILTAQLIASIVVRHRWACLHLCRSIQVQPAKAIPVSSWLYWISSRKCADDIMRKKANRLEQSERWMVFSALFDLKMRHCLHRGLSFVNSALERIHTACMT